MDINFSVLMSVYENEKASNLREAMDSIYEKQIVKPNEIIFVEDGKLTEDLYQEIEYQKQKLGNILKIISLEKNQGLGKALAIGLLVCKYEWVARMDTDDIAFPERFQKQLDYIRANPDVDIFGSFMLEFENDIHNIICLKDAPLDNMANYIKYRSPFNHPSVMFRKSKVLEAGNYQGFLYNEDSYLWIRMVAKKFIFKNISEPLVYFRVSDDTYKRRGGIQYVKSELKIQRKLLELKIINQYEYCRNILLKVPIRLLPNFLRKMIYLRLLRKKWSILEKKDIK